MLATLTGTGLASAAGLNAYIPLLIAGLLARYTDLLQLGSGWQWIEHPVALVIFGVLLALEFVADKIPAVDSVNDTIQTLFRPAAGGITFGAASSTADSVQAAGAAGAGLQASAAVSVADGGFSWVPIVFGVVIALAFHVLKAMARPVLNAVSLGVGGPVVSFFEDIASSAIALIAVILPILVVILVPLLLGLGFWSVRRGRQRRAEKKRQREQGAGDPSLPWEERL